MSITQENMAQHKNNISILVDMFPPSLQSILDQVATANREILEKPIMHKLIQLFENKGMGFTSIADLQVAIFLLQDHPEVIKGMRNGNPPLITIAELLGGHLEDEEKKALKEQSATSNLLHKQYSEAVARVLGQEGLLDDNL